MNRIVWVDMLRGFCMIAILGFHSEMYYASYDVIPYHLFVQNVLAAFFFISGYLFVPAHQQQTGLKPPFLSKVRRIAKAIIIPYFIFATLLAIPKALAHGEPLNSQIALDILCGYSFWFIAALVSASLLFLLLLIFSAQRQGIMAVVALVSLVLSNYIGNNTLDSPIHFHADFWHINEALLAMPVMCLGYLYRRHENALQWLHHPLYLIPVLLLFVLLKVVESQIDAQLVFGLINVSSYSLFVFDLLLGLIVYVGVFRHVPQLGSKVGGLSAQTVIEARPEQ